MRTRCFAVGIAAMTILTPACVMAKSGYVRPPPVHAVAAIPLVVPQSIPHISPDEVFARCGAHRHYDVAAAKVPWSRRFLKTAVSDHAVDGLIEISG
jgi:hypothetical protein